MDVEVLNSSSLFLQPNLASACIFITGVSLSHKNGFKLLLLRFTTWHAFSTALLHLHFKLKFRRATKRGNPYLRRHRGQLRSLPGNTPSYTLDNCINTFDTKLFQSLLSAISFVLSTSLCCR
jgi:hypothetical protein